MAALMLSNLVLVLLAVGCVLFQQHRRAKKLEYAIKIVCEAYSRGQYQKGLTLAESLKRRKSKTAAYWFFRGTLLYQLGDLSEAESCLRSGIALESEPRKKALGREALGKVQMEQKRYEEALRSFEASIQDSPNRGSGHRATAEAWLRQGIRDADALNFALLAVENARTAQNVTQPLEEYQLAESLTTMAWAVAVHSGEASEVERLIGEAFSQCGEDQKPVLGHLHYLAGAAYSVLGTTDARDQSAYHFQEAAAIDPQGNFGRLAKAAAHSAAV